MVSNFSPQEIQNDIKLFLDYRYKNETDVEDFLQKFSKYGIFNKILHEYHKTNDQKSAIKQNFFMEKYNELYNSIGNLIIRSFALKYEADDTHIYNSLQQHTTNCNLDKTKNHHDQVNTEIKFNTEFRNEITPPKKDRIKTKSISEEGREPILVNPKFKTTTTAAMLNSKYYFNLDKSEWVLEEEIQNNDEKGIENLLQVNFDCSKGELILKLFDMALKFKKMEEFILSKVEDEKILLDCAIHAAVQNNLKIIKLMFNNNLIPDLQTVAVQAFRAGKIEVFDFLFSSGVDVSAECPGLYNSPKIIKFSNRKLLIDVLEKLLKKKNDEDISKGVLFCKAIINGESISNLQLPKNNLYLQLIYKISEEYNRPEFVIRKCFTLTLTKLDVVENQNHFSQDIRPGDSTHVANTILKEFENLKKNHFKSFSVNFESTIKFEDVGTMRLQDYYRKYKKIAGVYPMENNKFACIYFKEMTEKHYIKYMINNHKKFILDPIYANRAFNIALKYQNVSVANQIIYSYSDLLSLNEYVELTPGFIKELCSNQKPELLLHIFKAVVKLARPNVLNQVCHLFMDCDSKDIFKNSIKGFNNKNFKILLDNGFSPENAYAVALNHRMEYVHVALSYNPKLTLDLPTSTNMSAYNDTAYFIADCYSHSPEIQKLFNNALHSGNLDVMKYVYQKKNYKPTFNQIRTVVENGYHSVFQFLHKKGLIKEFGEQKFELLDIALENCDSEMAVAIIEDGVDLFSIPRICEPISLITAFKNHSPIFNQSLIIPVAYTLSYENIIQFFDPNQPDSDGNLLLESLINYKLKTGIILSAIDDTSDENIHKMDQNSLIIRAAQKTVDPSVIYSLIARGVRVNISDNQGNTELHIVISMYQNNSLELIKALIEAGSNINAKNKSGELPITLAIMKKLSTVVEFFLDNGSEIQNIPKTNLDPFSASFSNHDIPTMIVLAHHGIPINMKNTAIIKAIASEAPLEASFFFGLGVAFSKYDLSFILPAILMKPTPESQKRVEEEIFTISQLPKPEDLLQRYLKMEIQNENTGIYGMVEMAKLGLKIKTEKFFAAEDYDIAQIINDLGGRAVFYENNDLKQLYHEWRFMNTFRDPFLSHLLGSKINLKFFNEKEYQTYCSNAHASTKQHKK